jgi:hypothetical protein
MYLCRKARTSFNDSSITFLARGEKGGDPVGRVRLASALASTRDVMVAEHLGRNRVSLCDQAQEDVLSSDETVVELTRLFLG